jgi:hypothetical protein
LEHPVSNRIYFNSSDHGYLLNKFGTTNKDTVYIQIKNFISKTDVSSCSKKGEICLSRLQRENMMLSTTMEYVEVQYLYTTNPKDDPFHSAQNRIQTISAQTRITAS